MTGRIASPGDDLGANELVVALLGVTKVFPGGVKALAGVDLAIRRGELLAVVGPSGSGKSTLLQIIGCLERPTEGRLVIAGHDTRSLSDRQLSALRGRMIGFVFQQFHLVESMSALDNVAAPLIYQGVRLRDRRDRAAVALERVGLGHRVEHVPSRLSGGERQRVAIARAIVADPALILADEPTGNLDSHTGRQIIDVLRRLNEQGATITMITHDRELAASLPRSVSMRDGTIEPALVGLPGTSRGGQLADGSPDCTTGGDHPAWHTADRTR